MTTTPGNDYKPFFVMLETQQNKVLLPLVDDSGDPMFFATKDEARTSARGNMLGAHFGYEIFERGNGDE